MHNFFTVNKEWPSRLYKLRDYITPLLFYIIMYIFTCTHVYACSVSQSCPMLCDPWTVARQAPCPWDSPGKNTGVGCHFFLQSIFPTPGSNPDLLCLLRWQAESLPLPSRKATYILYSLLAAAKSLQSCPTLCDPIDGSPPGSPVPGIL